MSVPEDLLRYHRQMLIAEFGEQGQRRLRSAVAMLVGCGALGTVVAETLVRAGIGTLVIVDRDTVELTNLQRQVLFDESDARDGVPKAEAAARRLGQINSAVRVIPIVADLTGRNAERIARAREHPAGIVLDGTDNLSTRYLLNDLSVKHGLPMVYGGAVATMGMTMTIVPDAHPPTACLRCVFPEPAPAGSMATCETAGILAPVAQMVAAMQAAEAIKILSGNSHAAARGLRQFDLWTNHWRAIDTGPARRSGADTCPCCGESRFEFLDTPPGDTAVLCGADSVQVSPPRQNSVGFDGLDLGQVSSRLAAHGKFTRTASLVRGRLDHERLDLTVFRDGRAIIRGTREPARAKSIYARYIGA